jgi:hypothetical protein
MLVICKRCVCVTGLLEELALWIGHDIKDGRFEWMSSGAGETSQKSNSDIQSAAKPHRGLIRESGRGFRKACFGLSEWTTLIVYKWLLNSFSHSLSRASFWDCL